MQQLVAEARAGKLEALSAWFPQVQYISRGYQTERRQPGTNANSAFLSQFNTTQQILSTTKYYDVKISGLHVELMQRLLDAVMIDVLYDVRATYYQVILDQETVGTAVENVELFTSLAERAEADWRIGTSILLNFNQAKVAVANATATYYQAVKQLKLDNDVLVRVLGYDPGSVEIGLAESEIPVAAIPDIGEKLARAEEVFAAESLKGMIFKPGFPEGEVRVMNALFTPGEMDYWETTALKFQPTLQSVGTEVKIARTNVRKCGENMRRRFILRGTTAVTRRGCSTFHLRTFSTSAIGGRSGLS